MYNSIFSVSLGLFLSQPTATPCSKIHYVHSDFISLFTFESENLISWNVFNRLLSVQVFFYHIHFSSKFCPSLKHKLFSHIHSYFLAKFSTCQWLKYYNWLTNSQVIYPSMNAYWKIRLFTSTWQVIIVKLMCNIYVTTKLFYLSWILPFYCYHFFPSSSSSFFFFKHSQ